MKSQLLTMLSMQDAMNTRVNPDWREAGNAWYRAIWTECAEMLDHYGWKWWKHQEPDVEQVKLEIVDIFHFAMSDTLLQSENDASAADSIEAGLMKPGESADVRETIERLAQHTLETHSVDYSAFGAVMTAVGMSFDELYRMYVGKNVLNFFRQDHGYKDGTYIKVWNGREDNEYLADLLHELDSASDSFKDDVYSGLQSNYPG